MTRTNNEDPMGAVDDVPTMFVAGQRRFRRWIDYPWGLCGWRPEPTELPSPRVGLYDMVLIDPALSAQARRHQIRAIKFAVPTLILGFAALGSTLLLVAISMFWMTFPAHVAGLLWFVLAVAMVPVGRHLVPSSGWVIEALLGRWAPASSRAVVTAADYRDMHHLQQLLITVFRQGQRLVYLGRRDDVVTVLWSAAADRSRISSAELLRTIYARFDLEHDIVDDRTWSPVTSVAAVRSARRRARHEAAHAVAAAGLGARVVAVSVTHHDEHGGQCQYDQVPGGTVCDRAWVNLVIAMAGNAADLEHGHHDQGARADIRAALEEVATIISTAHTPAVMRYAIDDVSGVSIEAGPMTTDLLLTKATSTAQGLLADHASAVRVIAGRLVHQPQHVLHADDMPELSTITTSARAKAC